MELSQLHFAYPFFLWAGLAIPLMGAAFWLFHRTLNPNHQLEKFIDAHLLPYLLLNSGKKTNSPWKSLLFWTAAWAFLTLALAGPRWNYREIETFSKDQSLVILLDLSESMNATDVKPSRLILAKQKAEDLINNAKGVKMGLIAFAADPHMIAPLTDDTETLRHLLPSLDTDLIYIQGSRLSPALDMAYHLLEAEPGNNKAIVVMSDGGFEDAGAIKTAKTIADKGISIHAMGLGTIEGAPINDTKGSVIKKNGTPVISKIEKERFREISKAGKGHYLEANPSDHEEQIILKELENRAQAQMAERKKVRLWEEKFYLPLLFTVPFFLWWFRKGALFSLIFGLTLMSANLHAEVSDYLKNSEQLGQQALDCGDYETAIEKFQDPYRKGVASYKAGKFAEAETLFRQSTRPEISSSAVYNLGNALVQQQKLQDAIEAYESVLQKCPDHTKAKENLELVKKMLEQQQQNGENSDNPDQQNENRKNDPNKQNQNDSESKKQEQNENSESENTSDLKDEQPQDPTQDKNPNQNESDKDRNEASPQNETNQDTQPDSQELQPQSSEEGDNSPNDNSLDTEAKAQEDYDADLLLNRMDNDPKKFMKNKFYIESKKNGTQQGVDPW